MLERVIYTDLDSLYDTMLSVISLIDVRLGKEYLVDTLKVPDYIGYLSTDTLRAFYADRNKEVLLMSKNSSVIDLIIKVSGDLDIKRKTDLDPVESSLILHVNSYPYNLTDVEMREMEEFLSAYIPYVDSVVVFDKPTLSDSYLTSITIMIIRDGMRWVLDRKLLDPTFKADFRLITSDRHVKEVSLGDVDKINSYIETVFMGIARVEFIEDELFKLKLEH